MPDHTFSLLDLELGSNGPSVFLPEPRLWSDPLSLVPACAAGISHHLLHDRLLALLMGELIEITLTSAAVQLQGEGRHRPTLAHFDPKRSFEAFTRLAYRP